MPTIRPVPDYIMNYYFDWDAKRQEWLKYAKECSELFYHNVEGTKSLYTKKQKKHINDSVGITSSINYIFSTISQAISLAIKNKPSHIIKSLDGQSEDAGKILEKVKYAVLHQSKENIQTREVLKDTFIKGMGVKLALEDYKINKKNLFGVKSKHIPIDEILLDANVKSPDFENEEGFFTETEMTLSNIKKWFPEIVNNMYDEIGNKIELMSLAGNSTVFNSAFTSSMLNKLEVRQFFEPIYTTMYMVEMPNGDIERIFKENIDEQTAILLDLDNISEDFKREDIFWKRTLIFGGYEVYSNFYAQSHSPKTVYFYEWGGSPYESYGMAHWEKEIQEAISAMVRLFILNGILSNNKGYRAEAGNIPPAERKKWSQHATNPQVLKIYNAVVKEGKVIIPEQEKVEQMSPFFPQVLGLLEKGITSTTGMYPYLAGDPNSQKIEVFSTLSQYQNTAMLRPQMILEGIMNSEEEHGNALVELIIDNIKPNKNYFFFDEKSDLKEFTIANEIVQSIKVFDYLLITKPAEAMASQRDATAEFLMTIAQSTQDPMKRDLYIDEAFRLKEIRGTESLREKTDVVKNAQAQLQQAQAAIDKANSFADSMEKRAINAEVNNKILQKVVNTLTTVAKEQGGLEELIKQTKTELNKKQNGENNG